MILTTCCGSGFFAAAAGLTGFVGLVWEIDGAALAGAGAAGAALAAAAAGVAPTTAVAGVAIGLAVAGVEAA